MSVPRRRLIAGALALAGALPAWGAGRIADSCPGAEVVLPGAPGYALYRRRTLAFGTAIELTVAADSRHRAETALYAALREIEAIDSVTSLYRPVGAVCTLNRVGRLDQAETRLIDLLLAARRWSSRSEGAFDVTVQPLWTLYAEAAQAGRIPDDAAVAGALARVDWRAVSVDDGAVHLSHPGMAISLNGIVQGYATDRALAILRAHDIRHALVDAGEFGALGGRPPIGERAAGHCVEPWSVGIRDPRSPGALLGTMPLSAAAVATSGDYEYCFTADRVHHHIFDPRVGRSPRELAAVTVLATNATDADALSTACMVLGAEAGGRLVATVPGAEALFVRKDLSMVRTAGFPLQPPA
ncbi:MAG: FAD:protein FMN transferase [Betaproteobacteria bacterium]